MLQVAVGQFGQCRRDLFVAACRDVLIAQRRYRGRMAKAGHQFRERRAGRRASTAPE